jgi:hypothetical protein
VITGPTHATCNFPVLNTAPRQRTYKEETSPVHFRPVRPRLGGACARRACNLHPRALSDLSHRPHLPAGRGERYGVTSSARRDRGRVFPISFVLRSQPCRPGTCPEPCPGSVRFRISGSCLPWSLRRMPGPIRAVAMGLGFLAINGQLGTMTGEPPATAGLPTLGGRPNSLCPVIHRSRDWVHPPPMSKQVGGNQAEDFHGKEALSGRVPPEPELRSLKSASPKASRLQPGRADPG